MAKSNYNMKYFLLLFLCIITQSYGISIPILSEEDCARFTVVNSSISHTGTDAAIATVTDGNMLYILKQIHDPSLDEQFLLINDCVASTIGYQAGIPVNQVSFIRYNIGAHLKLYPERAATLHEYITGIDLETILPSFLPDYFTLQQRVINHDSPWQKKYPLKVHEQGVTRTVIESMSCNRALVMLVALDTLTGNSDRSLPNIFYDPQRDIFCGIDQAAAFTRELPLYGYQRLQELVDQGYFFLCPQEVIEGLRLYRDTLRFLMQRIPGDTIMEPMRQLVPYLSSSASKNSEIREKMRHHQMVIERNYNYTRELIVLLDQIV